MKKFALQLAASFLAGSLVTIAAIRLVPAAAGSVSATSGWRDLEGRSRALCEKTYPEKEAEWKSWAAVAVTRFTAENAMLLARGTPNRERFNKICVSEVAEALRLCTEYRFGTDHAEECISRRASPVIEAAFDSSIAQ